MTNSVDVPPSLLKSIFSFPVIVASLGYFVDLYDLTLFSIVRVKSLRDLGLSEQEILHDGMFILNMQMFGILIGGVLWGIMGDKRGRKSVLFGSIILYSLANIANGFVQDPTTYAWIRFIAGIGLAGEVGVAITLVAEALPQQYRGYGTTIVATISASGAAVSFLVADLMTDWRMAYFIGGAMGLALLVLRFRLLDSVLFEKARHSHISRGNFFMLFQSSERCKRYIRCILLGVPLWSIMGIVVTFSPEIARALHIADPIDAGKGVFFCYLGTVMGDAFSGLLSQWLQSRKKAFAYFLLFLGIVSALLLCNKGYSTYWFYCGICLLGMGRGISTLYLTMTAETFGTNLRATVTTSAASFVRGSVVFLTFGFQGLQGYLSIEYAALIIVCATFLLAWMALQGLTEIFHRDLDFYER